VLKRFIPGIAMAAALMLAPQSAEAQRPVTVGVGAGLSVPLGDFSDVNRTGWNVTGGIGFNFPATNVGVRFEGFYNSFEPEQDVLLARRVTIAGATANALYHLGGQGMRPYVIGGIGAYNSRPQGGRAETDFGINAGAGVKFGLGTLNTFVEARLHTVAANPDEYQFVPIIFGIEF
jgi:opacity protein-like surface antigen